MGPPQHRDIEHHGTSVFTCMRCPTCMFLCRFSLLSSHNPLKGLEEQVLQLILPAKNRERQENNPGLIQITFPPCKKAALFLKKVLYKEHSSASFTPGESSTSSKLSTCQAALVQEESGVQGWERLPHTFTSCIAAAGRHN